MIESAALPKITILLYSSTIKFKGYDFQNVPTSTGRADMLIRVMKNALYLPDQYNSEIGFFLFPNQQFLLELQQELQINTLEEKGFLISAKSNYFANNSYKTVSEHELLQVLYNSFLHVTAPTKDSLFDKCYRSNFHKSISSLIELGFPVYFLNEEGTHVGKKDLFQNSEHGKICFVLGDQIGFSDIDQEALPKDITPISLGKTSFLGSTTITLIKWMIWLKQNNMHKL